MVQRIKDGTPKDSYEMTRLTYLVNASRIVRAQKMCEHGSILRTGTTRL